MKKSRNLSAARETGLPRAASVRVFPAHCASAATRLGGHLAQSATARNGLSSYRNHVNPQWAKLLDLLQMNVEYTRAKGAELFTGTNERILDFLSGYCVHNAGHNHPRIVQALRDELDRNGAAMVQSNAAELAGVLAARLCRLAGGKLNKVFFCSSGSEGIEAAIKFARARTRRRALLSCAGAFHGLTCGALSLMSDEFWTGPFGPMLPEAEKVPFGDIGALERALSSRRFAAFVVEPVQSEAGIRVPGPDYLRAAQSLCERHGSVFVLDEVQTGLYRTGPFLAAHRFGVEPDIVVLAKALSGGLVPSGAVLFSDSIYESVYGSLKRALIHTSTYSENALAMRAGIATLDVLEDERLGERARSLGISLRHRMRTALSRFEMVRDIRGVGLLCGIEFQPPKALGLRLSFEAASRIHPALFGQMLVTRLFTAERLLTQICGNNFMVLKAAPPLVVSEDQVEAFVAGLARTVELIHSSRSVWTGVMDMARRALMV